MKTKGLMPLVEDRVRQSAICTVIGMGGSRATAAKHVGVHPDTIRRAMERDESFAAAIAKAESNHEMMQLMNINKAARSEKFWRAAAWKLERKYPDQYQPRRPETISMPELNLLLRELARLVIEHVPGLDSQKQLLDRMTKLSRQVRGKRRRRRGRRHRGGLRSPVAVNGNQATAAPTSAEGSEAATG